MDTNCRFVGGLRAIAARFVDAVFGPVFRYFDVFDEIADFGCFRDLPKVAAWRMELGARDSVRCAVRPEYPALLAKFILERGSELSRQAAKLTLG